MEVDHPEAAAVAAVEAEAVEAAAVAVVAAVVVAAAAVEAAAVAPKALHPAVLAEDVACTDRRRARVFPTDIRSRQAALQVVKQVVVREARCTDRRITAAGTRPDTPIEASILAALCVDSDSRSSFGLWPSVEAMPVTTAVES